MAKSGWDWNLFRLAVIEAAIRGELTADWRAANPDVEPAHVLLERIAEEKAELIRTKQIRKEKPLPPIAPKEVPFDIPDSWEWSRLGRVAKEVHYGATASAKIDGDFRLVRITDIESSGRIKWPGVPFASKVGNPQKFELSTGDLLIARTGGTIGKVAIVQECEPQTIFASYLIRASLGEMMSSEFTFRFMQSPLYWHQLMEKQHGAQPNVSGTSLKELVLSIPPYNEQLEIVRRLEMQLEKLDALQHELEQSKEAGQLLMKSKLGEVFKKKTPLVKSVLNG